MSKERYVMKEQDESCTFRTYKRLMTSARNRKVNEDIDIKLQLNAGLVSMLKKSRSEMESILRKAESGGEI